MSKVFKADGTVEERLSGLEKYLEELSLHRDSRRGLEGPAGKNSTVPGPQGPPGRDADIREVIYAAEKEMHELLDQFTANLPATILWELQVRGVVDENGKAILIPGEKGERGEPGVSNVPGEKGDIGPAARDGVDGRPGRDAKIRIGSVITGETASVLLRDDGETLDFVLPRGERGETGATGAAGAGEKGDVGPEGQRGLPGVGLDKQAVVSLVLDMHKRGAI